MFDNGRCVDNIISCIIQIVVKVSSDISDFFCLCSVVWFLLKLCVNNPDF